MTDEAQLIFKDGNSNKFWHIALSDSTTTVAFGRIGTSGQTSKKNHGTAAKARTFFDKMVAEKVKKGYSYSKASNAASKRSAGAASASKPPPAKRSAKGKSDDDGDDDDEEEEKKVKPTRGRAGRGRKPEPEPEEEEEEEEEEDDDNDDGAESSANGPEGAVLPIRFIMQLSANTAAAFGLFADDKTVVAGDDDGVVIECSHTATEIKLKRKFQLPQGVKAIVKDGQFLYVGTKDGELFDLTQAAPRSMCKIEDFDDIYWIDVYDGCIIASSGAGDLALINGEGEVMWRVNSADSDESYSGGWMCRADASGIYHGHSGGVAKYNFKGKRLWWFQDISSVLFGVQTDKHVIAVGWNADEKPLTVKLDKKTGKLDGQMVAVADSCVVDASGKMVVVGGRAFNEKGVELWNFKGAPQYETMYGLSAALSGTRLFTTTDQGRLSLFDVSPAATKKATGGDGGKWKTGDASSAKAVEVSTSVEKTTDRSKGVEVECVKEGSKLRIRVVSKGFNSDWNVQFPRALRVAGAHFMCDDMVESATGGFYRAVGEIRRLA